MKEALRAVDAAVLIVDPAVDVANVGEVDELGGGLVEGRLPGFKRDAGGQSVGGVWDAIGSGEVRNHEEAWMRKEAAGREGGAEGAGGKHEELRLDAVDAGGGLQHLEQVNEEGLADGVGEVFAFAKGIDVAEDGLGCLKDGEGVAGDLTATERDEAGEDAAVEVLEQDGGRAGVVPEEAPLPAVGLFHEQRLQLRRGEVAQVEHFELGRETHLWTIETLRRRPGFNYPRG